MSIRVCLLPQLLLYTQVLDNENFLLPRKASTMKRLLFHLRIRRSLEGSCGARHRKKYPLGSFGEMKSLKNAWADINACSRLGESTSTWARCGTYRRAGVAPGWQYCGEADGDYALVISCKMNAPAIDKACNLPSRFKLSERRRLKRTLPSRPHSPSYYLRQNSVS